MKLENEILLGLAEDNNTLFYFNFQFKRIRQGFLDNKKPGLSWWYARNSFERAFQNKESAKGYLEGELGYKLISNKLLKVLFK